MWKYIQNEAFCHHVGFGQGFITVTDTKAQQSCIINNVNKGTGLLKIPTDPHRDLYSPIYLQLHVSLGWYVPTSS